MRGAEIGKTNFFTCSRKRFSYTGNLTDAPVTPSGLSVDRVWLPADPHTRIGRRTFVGFKSSDN
jgi:hypothetical protein